jgi:EPS-associated MarR family transcriptional regulator
VAVACLIFNFLLLLLPALMNSQDIRLDLLRKLESNPHCTQRELSREMGVSLGKVNYCMKKLTEKGLIKLTNFTHNPNKMGYAYLLTPSGIEEKSRLTFSFLKRKIVEYEILKKEINELKLESEEMANESR